MPNIINSSKNAKNFLEIDILITPKTCSFTVGEKKEDQNIDSEKTIMGTIIMEVEYLSLVSGKVNRLNLCALMSLKDYRNIIRKLNKRCIVTVSHKAFCYDHDDENSDVPENNTRFWNFRLSRKRTNKDSVSKKIVKKEKDDIPDKLSDFIASGTIQESSFSSDQTLTNNVNYSLNNLYQTILESPDTSISY